MVRPLPAALAALPAALALLATACSATGGGSSGTAPTFPPASPAPTVTTVPTPVDSSPSTAPTTPPTVAVPPDLGAVRIRLTEIGRFDEPVALTTRPGDRLLYVAEKAGRVVALDGTQTREVLDMTDRTNSNGEQGLLGLAFSPDGTHLYVSYTDNAGDSRLDEYVMGAAGSAELGSRREVLSLDQPYANHNGGHIVFGPDGLLYIGFGDGGAGGDPHRYGQDPRTWLGKLLRIDPLPSGGRPYSVPADNPYATSTDVLPEIWSAGLRNPWGFSFDPATGDLWVGDVGQNAIEEIDLVPAAQGAGRATNFGWSAYEGTARFNSDQEAPGHWPPIFEYHHGDAGCSVTGGVVYRGTAIEALRGAYLFGDYCAPGVNALVAEAGQLVAEQQVVDQPPQVVGFGTDADGEVYVLSLAGAVYRLDPA